MKKCPFCAEEIQDEAIYCRYCEKYLIDIHQKTQQSNNRNIYLKVLLIIVVIVFLLIAIFGAFLLGNRVSESQDSQDEIAATSTPTPAITLALTPWPEPTLAPTQTIPLSLILDIELFCNNKYEDRSTGVSGYVWSESYTEVRINTCIAAKKKEYYSNIKTPTPLINQTLTGVVYIDNAEIRDKPSWDGQIIFNFTYGQTITLIGRSEAAVWLKSYHGWVLSNSIITTDGHPSTLPVINE